MSNKVNVSRRAVVQRIVRALASRGLRLLAARTPRVAADQYRLIDPARGVVVAVATLEEWAERYKVIGTHETME